MQHPSHYDKRRDYYKKSWHSYYEAVIPLVPSGATVLDIGSGNGGLAAYLREEKGCDVTASDISPDAERACRALGLPFIRFDITDPIGAVTKQRKYDVVLLVAILEHVVDVWGVLGNVRSFLGELGHLIIGTPNFSYFVGAVLYGLGRNVIRFDDTEEGRRLGIQPYDHVRFFTKASLEHLLKKSGFEPEDWRYGHPKLQNPILRLLFSIPHHYFTDFLAVKAKKLKLSLPKI